ncbi:MAG: NAD-dependent epimerase/dehydratase family protein, partial [Rhodobacteraceae bacterium]|nr:NAD-dependent epimerase/dehydratase family protein [Paracoccaceae bacterium]
VELTFVLSTVEVTDDRAVILRGSSGRARMDFGADTLVVSRENAADLVVNPLLHEVSMAGQHLREGLVNALRQSASLNRKSPFGISFQKALAGFYAGVKSGKPDPRFSGASAAGVIESIEAALDMLPQEAPKLTPKRRRKPKPTALVIGGTGFIGQHLTRGLVAAGQDVRVLSRGAFGPFADLSAKVETVPVSLRDEGALSEAMDGISEVYNLAKSMDKTWQAALENDVGTSERIARAALSAGVRRLVYTGTIASYDMSSPDGIITEATGFGEDMTGRNVYARSKAECERRLMEMHREKKLPVTIARPGIVLGAHGPLQHWGIGRWHGAGAVRVWGNGRNILPFVLIEDVVDGLIRMGHDKAAIGESFNLVGARMWSARDYFDAIHKAYNARVRVSSGYMLPFYLADAVKYGLKRHVLRKLDATRPSLADWKSRAHLTPFDNSHPKEVLNWQPEPDEQAFARKAVTNVDLFGF